MNYYDQIQREIKQALEKQEFDQAAFLVRKEMEMPYIPFAFEKFLQKAQREIRAHAKTNAAVSFSDEQLMAMLEGDEERQMIAVTALGERNLRAYERDIAFWLQRDPNPEAAAMMIDALADQAVPYEFTYAQNGLFYTFYADAVTPVARQIGIQKALTLLESALARNPGLKEMARGRLIHEAFMRLPLAIEEEEAEMLVLENIQAICTMMEDRETYEQAKKMIEATEAV